LFLSSDVRRARSTSRVLAAMVALSGGAWAQQDASVPTFSSRAEVVTCDVVVLDREGRPVRGLTFGDFTVLEDGQPQPIVAFEARQADAALPERESAEERVSTNQPSGFRARTFAILLDDLGTQPVAMEEVKKSVRRWLREQALPTDELTLATVSGDVWWSDRVERGPGDLEVVLNRVKGQKLSDRRRDWITEWEAYRIVSSEDADGSLTARVMERTGLSKPEVRLRSMEILDSMGRRIRSVLSAVERVSRSLAGTRGRKATLVYAEDFLYDPSLAPLFDRVVDASQRGNTSIYFADANGLGGTSVHGADVAQPPGADLLVRSTDDERLETSGAEQLAENTGGTVIRNTNDLLGGLARVAEESSVYYLLGYQPSTPLDGKWHEFEVKVTRPGVIVRGRRAYQATAAAALTPPPPAGKSRKTSDGPRRPLDPTVMAGGAAEAISLRLAPYVVGPDGGKARVLVVVEVDLSTLNLELELERGRLGAVVDLTIIGLNRDREHSGGSTVDERVSIAADAATPDGWIVQSRELRLDPGVAQVRALVRDTATGLAGSVSQRLEVPALEQPYITTPILTDRVVMQNGVPRLVPLAHRRFPARGVLYCSYEVVGLTNRRGEATGGVAGSFILRRPTGTILRHAPSTRIGIALGGRVARIVVLPLAGMAPGPYELVLDVVDEWTGRSLRSIEPFVVEPPDRDERRPAG
jgi:VWFA-related protein